jgi:tetratricopeptide (TPR) repeat protein
MSRIRLAKTRPPFKDNSSMSMPSPSTPDSTEELLQLFWQRLGRTTSSREEASSQEQGAARRIVVAIGAASKAVTLAAEFADEFAQDLLMLANELEQPSEETQLMTAQPPKGCALIAATAVSVGRSREDIGDLPGAEHAYRWAMQQFHALGQDESLPLVLLGRVLQMLERLDDAGQCYREALGLDQAFGDVNNIAVDLSLLGEIAWLSGQFDEAERLCHQALTLYKRDSVSHGNVASTLLTLASVARERSHPWKARYYGLRRRLAQLNLP